MPRTLPEQMVKFLLFSCTFVSALSKSHGSFRYQAECQYTVLLPVLKYDSGNEAFGAMQHTILAHNFPSSRSRS